VVDVAVEPRNMLLCRFAPVPGFVALRQAFVRRCHSATEPRVPNISEAPRFKTLIYLKRFGVGARGALVSANKSLAQINKSPDGGRAYTIRQSGEDWVLRFRAALLTAPAGMPPIPLRPGPLPPMLWSHDLRQQSLADPAPPGRNRAQARPHSGRAADAHGHRLFGAPGQSPKKGLNRPGLKLAGDGLLAWDPRAIALIGLAVGRWPLKSDGPGRALSKKWPSTSNWRWM